MLIYNAIRTPDGTVLESKYRHDYQSHKDKNGETYVVDGGLTYARRVYNTIPYEELSLNSEDLTYPKIREILKWGSYGKEGEDSLKYILFKELGTEHIKAILNTQSHIPESLRKLFKLELNYRENLPNAG